MIRIQIVRVFLSRENLKMKMPFLNTSDSDALQSFRLNKSFLISRFSHFIALRQHQMVGQEKIKKNWKRLSGEIDIN